MKTQANEFRPEIEWEKGDEYDDAGDGHVYMYQATGESADGRKWTGTWEETDGEMVEITDIEEIAWIKPAIDPKTLPYDQQEVEFQVDIDSPVLKGVFSEDGQASVFSYDGGKFHFAWKVLHWRDLSLPSEQKKKGILPEMIEALENLLRDRTGCPFCDNGILRDAGKGHLNNCGWHMSEQVLIKAKGGEQ